MTGTKALFQSLVVLVLLVVPCASQQCEETARGQIETVLDKVTNRPLIREVIDGYGDEGKRILVDIAAEESSSAKQRGEAIRLLGEHRSEPARQLLLRLLQTREQVCAAVAPLVQYRSPELVPLFVALLDDHRSCGKLISFGMHSAQGNKETEVFLSDEVVDALERLTGQRLEQETDLFVIGHRATKPWKEWWASNREAYLREPKRFLSSEREHSDSSAYPCSVQSIAVSPDGNTAFSAGKSYDPWLRTWDIHSRQQLWAVPNGKDDDVNSATYSPDGSQVAIATRNGAIKVFEAASGRRLRMLVEDRGVNFVTYSPDGTLLATAHDDGTIRLFDTATWCERNRFDNGDMTEGVAFSPDGKLLAAATFKLVRLWDVGSATELRTLDVRPGATPKVFADAGQRDAELWRMAWRVAFSHDGTLVATGSSAAVQLWDVVTGVQKFSASSGGQVSSLHFTPDDRWLVWGNENDEIVAWSPSKHKRYRIKNFASLGDTAMPSEGKLVLSPGAGQEIAMYDLTTRKKVGQLRCEKTPNASSGTSAQ